jgi:hypothetical protein
MENIDIDQLKYLLDEFQENFLNDNFEEAEHNKKKILMISPNMCVALFIIGENYYFYRNDKKIGKEYLLYALENDLESYILENKDIRICEIYGKFYEQENEILEAIKFYSISSYLGSGSEIGKQKVDLLCDYEPIKIYYDFKYNKEQKNNNLAKKALFKLSEKMDLKIDIGMELVVDFKKFPDSEYICILDNITSNGLFIHEIYDLIYNKLWEKYMLNYDYSNEEYPHFMIKNKLQEIKEILEKISVYDMEYCSKTIRINIFAIEIRYMDYLGLFPLLENNEKYIPIIMTFYGNSKSNGILYSLMKLNPHKEFHLFVDALNYWEKNTNIMLNYVDYELSVILESYYDRGFDYNINKDFLNFFAVDPTRNMYNDPCCIEIQRDKRFLLRKLGNINYKKQRYDYAIKYYTLICFYGDSRYEYMNNIGVINCKKGDFDKAKSSFRFAGDKGIQNLCKISLMKNDKNEMEYLKIKNKYVEYNGEYIFYE